MVKFVFKRPFDQTRVLVLLQERKQRGLTPREGAKVLGCDPIEVYKAFRDLGQAVENCGWSPVDKDLGTLQESRYKLRDESPGGTDET